jgi:Zn-dependent protease with chaperone function
VNAGPLVPPPLPPAAPNSQWEGSLRPIAILAAAFVAVTIASCRYGVPVVASVAAERVPAAVVDTIGEMVMASFDASTFDESKIPPARQAGIVSRFSGLRFPEGATAGEYEIVFRRSDAIGANAMALPSGTIVVTDGLIGLSGADDEIVAVLAHEAGHVEHRHGLRLMFQSSFISAGISWLLGDISALAASASSALLEAKYSRDFEREADAYAVRLLDDNGIPRDNFVRMLERLDQFARQRGATLEDGVTGYLSSHPVTRDRIESIRLE